MPSVWEDMERWRPQEQLWLGLAVYAMLGPWARLPQGLRVPTPQAEGGWTAGPGASLE